MVLYIPGTATAADVKASKTFTAGTAYNAPGTMVERGAVTITPGKIAQAILEGYHNGLGVVAAVTFDASKLLAGTSVAGTAGTMVNNGAGGTVTPSASTQTKPAGFYSTAITISAVPVPAAKVLNDTTIAGTKGTMPDRRRATVGGYTTALSVLGDGWGSIVMEPPTGYYEAGKNADNYGTLIANDPNFVAANLINGKPIFGVNGGIPNMGTETDGVSVSWDGNWMRARIYPGAYLQSSASGYPEIRISAPMARADANITAGNIRKGVWIYGIEGQLLEGRPHATGITQVTNGTLTVSGLSFVPSVVVTKYNLGGWITRSVMAFGKSWSCTYNGNDSNFVQAVQSTMYVSGNGFVRTNGENAHYEWVAIGG